MINPDGSKLIQPFPHYEEQRAANGTLLKKRTSYSLGGQLIALDEDGTIRYAHNDHLGSPAILMQKDGDIVLNSTIARYKPYGGYLTQPTATALDRRGRPWPLHRPRPHGDRRPAHLRPQRRQRRRGI